MSELDFTDAELAQFLARFEATPEWAGWERTSGLSGRDLISIHLGGSEADPIRLAKGEGGYMAAGFGEWGLTVCASFKELLDALAPSHRQVA